MRSGARARLSIGAMDPGQSSLDGSRRLPLGTQLRSSALGPEVMISQIQSVKIVPWSQSTNSTSALSGSSEPSTSHSLACRLVQIILALYLIPAVLVVFLVGALGIMIVTVARILARLQGTTTS